MRCRSKKNNFKRKPSFKLGKFLAFLIYKILEFSQNGIVLVVLVMKIFRKRHDFLPKNPNFKFESKNSQKKLKFGQKFRISKFWSKIGSKNLIGKRTVKNLKFKFWFKNSQKVYQASCRKIDCKFIEKIPISVLNWHQNC